MSLGIKEKNKFKVLLVYPNLPLMMVASVAIALFTDILKKQGYQVGLFDTTFYVEEDTTSPQNRVKCLQARQFSERSDLGITIKSDLRGDFRKKVLDFKPDLLLVSVVEDAFLRAVKMLEAIEDLKIPHLLGGIFVTAAPERCMDFPGVHMIGIGEGEKTILDVAEAVRQKLPLHQISGTWFRGANGTLHKNPPQRDLANLDDFDVDFDLFDEKRFYRPMGGRIFKTIPVETYRGCPYTCTYCNSPMSTAFFKRTQPRGFLRRKSMRHLERELTRIIGLHKPEFFYFIDDSFLARPPREIDEFCEMYRDIRLPFWFNTRVENCTADNLKRLKDVGCYRISLGIECGNEEFRRMVLGRKTSNRLMIDKFEVAAESGISYSVNLMIGFPGETRDLVMDTVELVRSIRGYDTLTVSIFTPYHGTQLREVAVRNHWLDPKAITVHTTADSMLKMPSPYLSVSEISGLMRVLPLYCYFSKEEWPLLKRAESADAEGDRLLKHDSEIYRRDFLKQTQDDAKEFIVAGGTGCRSNEKDSFRISPSRLSRKEIQNLTL